MEIAHLVAEFSPFIKVGGIADVLQGFTQETMKQGHNVSVYLPKYDGIHPEFLDRLHVEYENVPSFYEGKWHKNTIWKAFFKKVPIYLIESHHPLNFFERGMVYGCEDDVDRFLYFNRAVFDLLNFEKKCPEIFHLHDWHTAISGPLYYDIFADKLPGKARIVFTIHNLEYQGRCQIRELDRIGLDGKSYLTPDKLQDNYDAQNINLLKGGIVYSNYTTTVSPKYAEEALTPEGGRGLDTTLNTYAEKFSGILNGIDITYWNPKNDPALPHHFSPKASVKKIIEGKSKLKAVIQDQFDLEITNDKPLVACIARLVPQKGLDLIEHAMQHTLELGGQFILLGETLIPEINEHFHKLKKDFSENKNIHLELKYCENLAHLIFAGSDLLIVPSIFEPCGLVQMIAMRHGTVPIARNTGGLANTVFDIDYYQGEKERNGYMFDNTDNQGIDSALERALNDWMNHRKKWEGLIKASISIDHSWNYSLKKFLSIYKEIHA